MFLWTAFLIGLLGSFHCVGMCGPIALALPIKGKSKVAEFLKGMFYNAGRIITYTILGGIFGLVGKGLNLAGLQQVVSIVAGCIMIAAVVVPLISRQFSIGNIYGRLVERVIGSVRKMLVRKSLGSLFAIGLLNGLLPCGLVYVALAGAINQGDILSAMILMLAFGTGTIPVMLSVSLAGTVISIKLRNSLSRVTPYVIIFIGILFILRGLALGIPYISPKTEALVPVVEKAHKCCKP